MAKDALGHGSEANGLHAGKINALPVKETSNSRNLTMFADNDANLYRQSKVPVEKNLEKKMAKGVYDHDKATKLWGYHADRAAQSYSKQYPNGQKWHEQFSPGDRKAAAASWANTFKADHS